ncbi:hypothetical protein SK128_016515 [Halocaridina rubra]|uniref:RING-type domain-containing protein n=1 Tax=Halocaridina rubra TaxID=373956 RepID=A0AAN8XDL4_HALRR
MASNKTSIPEGESPSQCPVCLEPWDNEERLPKFLICHHSICVTCAADMQKTAKKPTKHLAEVAAEELRASRGSLESLDALEEGKPATWVRCPMCRTKTFIEDPYLLQTNFYLSGMTQNVPIPRLVLWCETCSCVATPDCEDHILLPTGEKMRDLQDDLVRRAEVLQGGVSESLSAHECHMEVYRWLCGMLRHAHSKVLAALTHGAQYHQALQLHVEALQNLVQRGEQLQLSDEPEDVIKQLTSLLRELNIQQSSINAEVELPILKDTFQVLRTHQGPKGFGKALVVLDANKSVTLSVYGENDRLQQSCTSDEDAEVSEDVGITLMRAMSMQAGRRRSKNKMQVIKTPENMELLSQATTKHETPVAENLEKDKTEELFSQAPVSQTPVADNHELDNTVDSPINQREPEISRESDPEMKYEEPIITIVSTLEATAPPIEECLQLDSQNLKRNGNFGRGTVTMAYKRYPSHLCDEEPITDPRTIVTPKDDTTENLVIEKALVEEEKPAVTSIPKEQGNEKEKEIHEEYRHPRPRNNRRKRRQVPPSEMSEEYAPQRQRRQNTRRRPPKKKKAMCVIA